MTVASGECGPYLSCICNQAFLTRFDHNPQINIHDCTASPFILSKQLKHMHGFNLHYSKRQSTDLITKKGIDTCPNRYLLVALMERHSTRKNNQTRKTLSRAQPAYDSTEVDHGDPIIWVIRFEEPDYSQQAQKF